MRDETVAAVAEEFGNPTEPVCGDWPHSLCVKWTLPSGVELHVTAEHDDPYIDAFESPSRKARWEQMPPSQVRTRPSITEWLKTVGFLPMEGTET